MATITSLGFNITSDWNGDGVKAARADIQALEVEMRRVSGAALSIDVVVDTAAARAELEEMRDMQGRMVIDVEVSQGSVAQTEAEIEALTNDRKVNIGFEVNQASYAEVEAQLEFISSMIDDVSISFDINEASFRSAEARIAMLTRDRTINIDIDTRGGDGLVNMNNTINQVSNSSDDMGNRTSRAMRMARLGAMAFTASLGVIPAAITAIGAALSVIPGIAGVALGGALLSRVESVRNAFDDLGGTILEIGDRAVVPMVQPVLDAVGKIKVAIKDMEPVFRTTFENSAKLVTPLTDTMIAFVQRIMPGFNAAIGNSVPLFNGLQEGVKNFATSLSRMFEAMSKKSEDFGMTWNLWFTYIGRIMEAFGYAAADMVHDTNEIFGDSLRSIEKFFRGFNDGLVGMTAALANANGGLNFFWVLGDMLRIILPAFGNFYAEFSKAFGTPLREAGIGVADLAASILNSLASAMSTAAPYLERFAFYLGQGFDALSKINGVIPGLTIAIGILFKVIMKHPLIMLATAVITIIGYLWDLEKRTGAVSDAFKKAWGAIEPAVMPVVSKIVTGANQIKDSFDKAGGASGVWDKVKDALAPIGDFFGKLADTYGPQLSRIGQTFMEAFSPLWEKIKPGIMELWDSLKDLWTRLQPVIQVIGGAIGALVGGILGMVEHGIKPASEIIASVFNGITGVISGFIDAITAGIRIITGIIEIVVGVIKGVAAALTGNGEAFHNAMDNITSGVKNVFGGLGNLIGAFGQIIKNIWDMIVGIFKNGVGLVVGIVRGFIDGVINFFQRMWDTLVGHSIIPDTINAIIKWFKELPGKVLAIVVGFIMDVIKWFATLPSRVFDALKEFGTKISAAFQAGVDIVQALWDKFWAFLMQRWDNFKNNISNAWNAFWDFLKERWENFKNNIQNAWNAAWDFLVQRWENFKTNISNAWNAFWDFLMQRWDNFKNNIQNAWEAVWRFLTEKWESFKSTLSSAWSTFWESIRQTAQDIWDKITGAFDAVKDKIIETVTFITTEVKRIWDGITGIFQGPVDAVKNIWNGVAGAFGLTPLQIGQASGGPAGIPDNMAVGGDVRGKGTGTSDDIPVMLSNGEHVLTAAEVDAAGGHGAIYDMRMNLRKGRNPNMGLGNPANDNRFATGGPVTLAPAISMARDKGDGRAYVYGGTGPEGFDCSGYMSAIYNILTSRSPWGRSFSTESDFGSLGFINGLGPGFSIGIKNGGGGPNSHMAGTLDGVNVESGGSHNSTRYGGPAQGADSSYFPRQLHLPLGVDGNFVSGGAGGGASGPSAEQIRMHDEAIAGIKKVIDETNATSASKKFGTAAAEGISLRAMDANGAKNQFGTFAPAGDTHAGGTHGAGFGAIGKLDAALAAASAGVGGAIGGSIPEGDRLNIINEALRVTNTPPPSTLEAWQRGMNTLITRESGWNPSAINGTDINAQNGVASRGLAQVIPPTFESNKAAGYNNIMGAVDNVAASINYIKRTYGTIENVQQANANMAPKGYKAGTNSAAAGWAMVGENGPEAVQFQGGEKVKTFEEIISTLKSASAGEGKALVSKVSADFDTFTKRLADEVKSGNQDMSGVFREELAKLVEKVVKSGNDSGNKLAVTIEDAIERVLREAGVNISLPLQIPQGADANTIVNEVVKKVEAAVRQGVGAHA